MFLQVNSVLPVFAGLWAVGLGRQTNCYSFAEWEHVREGIKKFMVN